jgi:hypothetical protein
MTLKDLILLCYEKKILLSIEPEGFHDNPMTGRGPTVAVFLKKQLRYRFIGHELTYRIPDVKMEVDPNAWVNNEFEKAIRFFEHFERTQSENDIPHTAK